MEITKDKLDKATEEITSAVKEAFTNNLIKSDTGVLCGVLLYQTSVQLFVGQQIKEALAGLASAINGATDVEQSARIWGSDK